MPKKVVLLSGIGKITLSQTSRSKQMKLSVRPGNRIMVSFPAYVTFREAALFARNHADWIIKQQDKYTICSEEHKTEFPLKTRFHEVNIQPDGEKFSVLQKKFQITIQFPAFLSEDDYRVKDYTGRVLRNIYRWEARAYLPGRLSELALQHGFDFRKVTIRDNKTNWGSCSSKNNISLNLHLMKLPDNLIDFVLLHELVHTRVKNHSPDFWRLLDSVTHGKAREITRAIRKFSIIK
jgi:predicted metal-dependent hydrolase